MKLLECEMVLLVRLINGCALVFWITVAPS
jgi:hypothetical protein